jgi:uncharacterized protein YbjT (DUF2867 family)
VTGTIWKCLLADVKLKTGTQGGFVYAVTGATGHTGSIVADALLAAGKKVRVIGRDAKRLERFTHKGAEAFVADATDAAAITNAFSGAEAAYLMIPPFEARVGDSLVSAVKKNTPKHVVVLSSYGADKPDKTGPILGLRNLERKLESIAGLNALFLRPGYFMENLLSQIWAINSLGFMAGPVRADLPLPMIATHDVGAVAAEALLKSNFEGRKFRELQGPRDVTYTEAAALIGGAIGKPGLIYQQLPAAQLRPAFQQLGMSPNQADLLLEMAEALNANYMRMLEPRSSANTTPTTIETFIVETFVPAYRAKAAGA